MTSAPLETNHDGSADATSLRSADHDRDMHNATATVTAIEFPTRDVLRLTAALSSGSDDPAWRQPNVALRLQLEAPLNASRVYTVREFDASSGSIVVDVVLHGEASPMMKWAKALTVGSVFEFRGPRAHFTIPTTGHRRVACFADSTAIPALFALLQEWPEGVEGEIWIESDDVGAVDELTPPAEVTIRRISTANAEGLLACARSIPDPAAYVVWGAGERDSMKAIRSYFRTEVGLGKHDVAVFGYWKKGVSNTEIDDHRLRAYEAILARGGTLDDLDDAEIGI